MTEFANKWAAETWAMVLDSSPWLFGGFLLAGVVYVMIPVAVVTRHLGRSGFAGVVKAALFGIPLPLCSCSVIPVAASIRKQGASRGAFTSFLISTPETGVDSFAISYALLGPFLAIARPVAAFVTAIVAGMLVGADDADNKDSQLAAPHDCCSATSSDSAKTVPGKFVTAIRYGLVDMIVDLAPWLVIGFALAGLASALIPAGFFEEHVGTGLPAMLLMLVVGLPMYVCATSSTPIAAALIARGLSPGAALVFLLAGPATNLATMVVVSRDLGRRGLAIYLITIAVVAVISGIAVDALFPALPVSLATIPCCQEGAPPAYSGIFAWGMTLLVANGLRIRTTRWLRTRSSDQSCTGGQSYFFPSRRRSSSRLATSSGTSRARRSAS